MAQFVIPKSLNYHETIPSSLGSSIETMVITPQTGAGSYTSGNQIVFFLPRVSDAVFDPQNSYLRFKFTVNGSAAMLSGSIDTVFYRLDVRNGGNQLELINNYHVLSSVLMDSLIDPSDRQFVYNALKGCAATSGSQSGYALANAASQYFQTQFVSGIVGTCARSYIPLYALGSPLEIWLTLNDNVQTYCTANAAGVTESWTMSDVEFHAVYVKLSNPTLEMISVPEYKIHTESYSNFQANIAATTTAVEQLVPFHYSSLKTLLLSQRLQACVTNVSCHSIQRSTFNISQYYWRVGSKCVPQTRIKADGYNNIEVLAENMKAYHRFGTYEGFGINNLAKFSVSNCSIADEGTFCIMQDFESMSGDSGKYLQGLDTNNIDVFFSAIYNTGPAAAGVLDFFAHFDLLLLISNGVIRAMF